MVTGVGFGDSTMDSNKLILFDWDNTISQRNGCVDLARFKDVIEHATRKGWSIGLNSDTPLKRLQSWYESLGMNGPIIAEKGAVVWTPAHEQVIVSQTQAVFAKLRADVAHLLIETPGITVYFGDNTEFIRTVSSIGGADSTLVAVDAFRVCSLGLFIRQVANGVLNQSSPASQRVVELIQSIAIDHPAVSKIVRLNDSYGFASIAACDCG